MTRRFDLLLRSAAALAVAFVVVSVPSVAQPVVQPLPDPAQLRLNEALRTLGQDPRSVPALVAAGQASIGLDDVDAAAGFFARAAAVAPADGAVNAGLAAVAARQGRPIDALQLFVQAEAAGEPMQMHAAERGLAYDLVGDNARAQEQYYVSLSLGPDPEVVRRLSLSQAIAGDQRGSEATLLPLLQRRDLAAYRIRAFALAILGKPDEAVSIAETMLPERVSSRIAPYLRYMPRLTRAQQAAAAILGTFPRAAEIGRDGPAIAAYAAPPMAVPPARTADARLVPSGQRLGNRETEAGGVPRRELPAAPVAQQPAVQAAAPVVVAQADPAPIPAPAPAGPVVIQADPAPPAQLPAQPAPVPQVVAAAEPPAPVPADNAPSPVVVATPPPQTAAAEPPRPSIDVGLPPPAQPEVEVNLAEAFADFTLPSGEAVPSAGAVDITKIQPRRETPRPPPPPRPVHPSRQWVQVATGRDVAALEFDWRRIKRNAGGLLDKYKPHVATWGQTNRLVAGPFANEREAQDFVAKLKEKQLDSFRFTSSQGEEVRPIE
ncbi:MAG TPA: SPOR domain-containing protein [Croceibacterium sp.]